MLVFLGSRPLSSLGVSLVSARRGDLLSSRAVRCTSCLSGDPPTVASIIHRSQILIRPDNDITLRRQYKRHRTGAGPPMASSAIRGISGEETWLWKMLEAWEVGMQPNCIPSPPLVMQIGGGDRGLKSPSSSLLASSSPGLMARAGSGAQVSESRAVAPRARADPRVHQGCSTVRVRRCGGDLVGPSAEGCSTVRVHQGCSTVRVRR